MKRYLIKYKRGNQEFTRLCQAGDIGHAIAIMVMEEFIPLELITTIIEY